MTALGAKQALGLLAALALSACTGTSQFASASSAERAGIEARLTRDIAVLSSDAFEGRKPGTLGAERTIAFITDAMEDAGLVSGTNDPGSAWRAPVELVSTRPFTSRMELQVGRRSIELGEDAAAAFSNRRRELIQNAPLVFVGKEAESVEPRNIAGTVVVMLGDPGESPGRRAILFEKEPAAIITVVADEAALARVKRAYGRESVRLKSEANGSFSAFVTASAMEDALGKQWPRLVESAGRRDFEPLLIEAGVSIEANSQRREFTSYNVVGLLPGTQRNSGAVVMMAHWDHLGECGDENAADRICNGAVDNASGIAVMLELARRLVAGQPFDRDIYFVATSAEESGLLGAHEFVARPPMPLESIVAAFNFDTVAIAPAGSPLGFVGEGRTALDPVILEAIKKAGRDLGDKDFAEQFVRRQDGWALLQEGLPAVLLSSAFASEITLGPYLSDAYHRANDEAGRIELGGAIDDLLLHEEIVRMIANTDTYSPPGRE